MYIVTAEPPKKKKTTPHSTPPVAAETAAVQLRTTCIHIYRPTSYLPLGLASGCAERVRRGGGGAWRGVAWRGVAWCGVGVG